MTTQRVTDNSISLFFERDHREIDSIYDRVRFQNAKDDLPLFQEFSKRLDRHIQWEEKILFPAVAKRNPQLEMGPIRIMKMEHEAIRDSKAKALTALNAADVQLASEHCETMIAILKQHNMKEEHILYPACDQTLDAETAGGILRTVKADLEDR